jgi:hypothetical protein
VIEPGNRWNPLLNAFSAFYNGAEFDQVSVRDYAAYDDSEVNWRVAEGYGAALATLAPDVSLALRVSGLADPPRRTAIGTGDARGRARRGR